MHSLDATIIIVFNKHVKMPAQNGRVGMPKDLEVLIILRKGSLLSLLDVLLDLLLPLRVHGHLEEFNKKPGVIIF